MSKRLPEPADPKRVRLVLSDAELRLVELMAFETRTSVAGAVRAAVLYAAETWPDHRKAIEAIIARIAAVTPPGKRKPGRPPKNESSEPKKGKK